jgi:hypothetical protein
MFSREKNIRQIVSRECLLYFGAEYLSSSLLYQNIITELIRNLILHDIVYWSEICPLTFSEGRAVFENRVLTKIFRSKMDQVTMEWRRLHREKLYDLYYPPNIPIVWVIIITYLLHGAESLLKS